MLRLDPIKLHDFADKEYWLKRWADCQNGVAFSGLYLTYPPELAEFRSVDQEVTERFLIFKRVRQFTVSRWICRRCGEPTMTFHLCADLREFANEHHEQK